MPIDRTDPDYWRACLASDIEYCKEMLTEKGSLGMLYTLRNEDKLWIVPVMAFDLANKSTLVEMLRALAIAYDCTAVTLLTEAWVSTIALPEGKTPDEVMREANRRGITPSQDPNRKEVVVVSAQWRKEDGTLGSLAALHEIQRNADGSYRDLGPDMSPDNESPMRGALGTILPKTRPTEAIRDLARMLVESLPDAQFRPVVH